MPSQTLRRGRIGRMGCALLLALTAGLILYWSSQPDGHTDRGNKQSSAVADSHNSSNSGHPSEHSKANEQKLLQQTVVTRLQTLFLSQGAIVSVLMEQDGHTLELDSDDFVSPNARYSTAEAFRKQKSDLCRAGIWNVDLTHIEGLANIKGSRVRLGCAEQENRELKQREAASRARQEFAASVNAELKNGYHLSVQGTTLVMESSRRADARRAADELAGGFLDDLETLRKFCSLGFLAVKVKNPQGSATAPLPCPRP